MSLRKPDARFAFEAFTLVYWLVAVGPAHQATHAFRRPPDSSVNAAVKGDKYL